MLTDKLFLIFLLMLWFGVVAVWCAPSDHWCGVHCGVHCVCLVLMPGRGDDQSPGTPLISYDQFSLNNS